MDGMQATGRESVSFLTLKSGACKKKKQLCFHKELVTSHFYNSIIARVDFLEVT